MDETVNTAVESTHSKHYLLDCKPYTNHQSTLILKRDAIGSIVLVIGSIVLALWMELCFH